MASEARKLTLHRYFGTSQFGRGFPIPREKTAYAYAKAAEYIEKNLEKAEHYYREAIETGERPESALKDLAGILHQQGKTQEACDLLRSHRSAFVSDIDKYENLLKNLEKQMVPSRNTLNKAVKVSGLGLMTDEVSLKGLFLNSSRILHVEFGFDFDVKWAILRFSSHSAARKTFEGFKAFHRYVIEWMSITGEIVGLYEQEIKEFSLFSFGKYQMVKEIPSFYSYFPNRPCRVRDDPIDQVLENSIFSYF